MKPKYAGKSILVKKKKVKFSWEDTDHAFKRLLWKLQDNHYEKFNHIYCIGRGGMVLGRLLAGALQIPSVNIHYTPVTRDNQFFEKIEERSILVDDILDTGGTFQRIRQVLEAQGRSEYICVFLVARQRTMEKYLPHSIYYGQSVRHDNYIIFPWEEYDRS